MDEAFELGDYGIYKTFSCFKQRSPFQAQYDKVGVFDNKLSDFIIPKDINEIT